MSDRTSLLRRWLRTPGIDPTGQIRAALTRDRQVVELRLRPGQAQPDLVDAAEQALAKLRDDVPLTDEDVQVLRHVTLLITRPALFVRQGTVVDLPTPWLNALDRPAVDENLRGVGRIEHPDGQLLQTREKESFLVINGIQTQSAKVHNLVGDMPALRAAGVDILRISPQSQHTDKIIAAFDAARRAAQPNPAALQAMRPFMPEASCNGYWHGRPGLDLIEPALA